MKNAQTADVTSLIAALDSRVQKATRDLRWVEEQLNRPDLDEDYRESYQEQWMDEKSELIEAEQEQAKVLELLKLKR